MKRKAGPSLPIAEWAHHWLMRGEHITGLCAASRRSYITELFLSICGALRGRALRGGALRGGALRGGTLRGGTLTFLFFCVFTHPMLLGPFLNSFVSVSMFMFMFFMLYLYSEFYLFDFLFGMGALRGGPLGEGLLGEGP